jgi:hypothetical protein
MKCRGTDRESSPSVPGLSGVFELANYTCKVPEGDNVSRDAAVHHRLGSDGGSSVQRRMNGRKELNVRSDLAVVADDNSLADVA